MTGDFTAARRLLWTMILSDGDILRRLEEGDLVIEPLEDLDLQVQGALFFDAEVLGVLIALLVPLVVGIVLPLTE